MILKSLNFLSIAIFSYLMSFNNLWASEEDIFAILDSPEFNMATGIYEATRQNALNAKQLSDNQEVDSLIEKYGFFEYRKPTSDETMNQLTAAYKSGIVLEIPEQPLFSDEIKHACAQARANPREEGLWGLTLAQSIVLMYAHDWYGLKDINVQQLTLDLLSEMGAEDRPQAIAYLNPLTLYKVKGSLSKPGCFRNFPEFVEQIIRQYPELAACLELQIDDRETVLTSGFIFSG